MNSAKNAVGNSNSVSNTFVQLQNKGPMKQEDQVESKLLNQKFKFDFKTIGQIQNFFEQHQGENEKKFIQDFKKLSESEKQSAILRIKEFVNSIHLSPEETLKKHHDYKYGYFFRIYQTFTQIKMDSQAKILMQPEENAFWKCWRAIHTSYTPQTLLTTLVSLCIIYSNYSNVKAWNQVSPAAYLAGALVIFYNVFMVIYKVAEYRAQKFRKKLEQVIRESNANIKKT